MEEEIWKDIEGYEGLYQVSNLGRVRSLDRIVEYGRGGFKTLKGKILKGPTVQGYKKAQLSKDGKKTIYAVHRLVAQAFIPNPENKPYIDHINTDKSNNRVENLRWTTAKENANNPLTRKNLSKAKKGEKCNWYGKLGNEHHLSKAIYQISKDGNLIRKWGGMCEAERYTGVYQSNITLCCLRKRRTSGGYRWIYAEDLDAFLIDKMNRAIEKRKRTA